VSAATTSSETGAPSATSPWGAGDLEDTASVGSIVVRFAVATAAVLALASLVAARTHGQIGPTAGVLLTLLLAVQIPFVWRVASAMRAAQRERDRLLDASRSVRRQIATDLHDGIVQDLSGVSFQLAALGRNESIDPAAVADAAESLRMTLGSFRFVLDETLLDR
jgi:signal transduction histidine kinase